MRGCANFCIFISFNLSDLKKNSVKLNIASQGVTIDKGLTIGPEIRATGLERKSLRRDLCEAEGADSETQGTRLKDEGLLIPLEVVDGLAEPQVPDSEAEWSGLARLEGRRSS